MRTLIALAAVAVAGLAVSPVAVSAADTTPAYMLTLAPGTIVVPPGQHTVEFLIVNSGQPVQVHVSTSDAWVAPTERAVTLGTNQRHTFTAAVQVPAGHDDGDHETQVAFSVAPSSTGTLKITRALASRVIIATGGTVAHGLHVFGLSLPAVADSFDNPTVQLTVSNTGNVHEVVSIEPFGTVLVLRDSSRVLSLTWARHPWLGMGTITAGGSTASTLFFPWRILLGLLAFSCGIALSLAVRRSRTQEVPYAQDQDR